MYSLTRMKPEDGAGDSGLMCHKVRWDKEKQEGIELPCDYPEVGWCLKVGSPYARTFGQDWWRTSPVTKILEETEDEESVRVVFKTGNSTYAFRKFK
jgi:hypothetical protein